MEFFIFRHGETPNNRRLLWQGQSSDVDLNGNGIRQAGDLAHTMQRKNLEVIVSSPSQRALHTAKIVAKQCQIPVLIREDLKEIDYGLAESLSYTAVEEKWPTLFKKWLNPGDYLLDFAFENGETAQQALDRFLQVLKELSQSHQHECVGISTHGGIMAVLLGYLGVYHPNVKNCGYLHIRHNLGGEFTLVR